MTATTALLVLVLLPVLFVALVALVVVRRAARRLADDRLRLQHRMQAQEAELLAAVEQMRQARDAAEAADRAKTRFLAAASHDLRQPAHALGLYAAALGAAALPAAQREIVLRMQESLAALQTMFGALLDVSRIDAGEVSARWETIALAPLLHRLAQEWAPAAEAAGLRLAVHVADPDAATVTDALLLERIVRNLLANAVAYTRQGGVLLACRLRTSDDGTRRHRIEVWDSGIGIAAPEQARVFEEFYQCEAGSRGGGLGLGLALVQRLAQLLQLRVTVDSRPGRGSVFRVEGLGVAGDAPLRVAAQRQEMRRLQGLAVGVLEDDADVRDAMIRLLGAWGCRVVAGADAAELGSQSSGPPDALIADLRLQHGRDGYAEAQRLAARWGRMPPLLLLSAEADARATHAAAEGAGQVLAKPASPARLRAWLESLQPPEPKETER